EALDRLVVALVEEVLGRRLQHLLHVALHRLGVGVETPDQILRHHSHHPPRGVTAPRLRTAALATSLALRRPALHREPSPRRPLRPPLMGVIPARVRAAATSSSGHPAFFLAPSASRAASTRRAASRRSRSFTSK